MNSQTDDFICATPENLTTGPSEAFSHSTDLNVLSGYDPIVMSIFFWGINDDNGDSENKLTEADVLKAIAQLNIKYNVFNIFFKYRGFDFIDSTRFYEIYHPTGHPDDDGEPSTMQALEDFVEENNNQYRNVEAINIYVPYSTVGFSGVYLQFNKIILNSEIFENDNSRVITHEMGHALGLKHTHQYRNRDFPLFCENVTRDPLDLDDPLDPNDTFFNADVAGDEVTDTAAVPNFRREHYWEFIDEGYQNAEANDNLYEYISEDCNYFNPNGRDCQNTLYEISEEDVRNLMAYTFAQCGQDLTTGQGIRMREWIVYNNSTYYNVIDSVSSLFEPYKGEYYVSGPYLETHRPLFQPGFEYRFIECEGPYSEPAPYDTTFPYDINTVILNINNDETDYYSITHPNHTAILLVNNGIGNNELSQPQKCYDNWNEEAKEGSITRFNDNIFNTNVTITPQDSTSINSQYLIQNLNSGLYKIEKNYRDGSSQETIIFKENN